MISIPPPPSVHHLHVHTKRPRPKWRGRRSSFLPLALAMLALAAIAGAGWYTMAPGRAADDHAAIEIATDETLRLWRKGSVPAWDEARFHPNEPVAWTIRKSSITGGVAWVPVDLEGRSKQGVVYHGRYFLRWQKVRGEWRLADVMNKEAAPLVPPDLEWMLR